MTVMVYNAGGTEVLHTCTLHHAIRMLRRQVARVKDAVPGETFGPYQRPRAVELVRYVYAHWRNPQGTAPYSRRGVLARDGHTCGYCGKHATTIDHVVPRAHGGATNWLNCVAACTRCNGKKGDKPLAATGMRLQHKLYAPTATAMLLALR